MIQDVRTERLTLRPVEAADAAAFCAIANDPAQTRMTGSWRYPFSVADAETRWAPFLEAGPDGPILLAILNEGRLVGTTGLHEPEDGSAELSYWIGRGFEGRGFGYEAAHGACGFAFGPRRLRRLTARVFADNTASRRILDKLGFVVLSHGEAEAADREGAWPSYTLELNEQDWQP